MELWMIVPVWLLLGLTAALVCRLCDGPTPIGLLAQIVVWGAFALAATLWVLMDRLMRHSFWQRKV